MPKMVWDQTGEKLYETGVDRVGLYLESAGAYPVGVPWNGVTGFTESPSGADANNLYADNHKYLTLRGPEDYSATLKCYTYPRKEWAKCDGSKSPVKGVYVGQQTRSTFGLTARTLIGNDTEGQDHGYTLHLIYGATASPSEREYGTVNDSPDGVEFSYELTSTPVPVSALDADGKPLKPVSSITIDSTEVDATKLAALEKILYGNEETEPRLPLPDEVITLLKSTT